MNDGPQNQAKSLAAEVATKQAEQPNILADLTQSQSETFDLVSALETRLQGVAYSEPSDVAGINGGGNSIHIGYNLENQQGLNSRLRRILKSLVV